MVRRANQDDYDALVALFVEENLHNHTVAPDRIAKTSDVLTPEELTELIADDACLLSVFELGGKPVGLILASYRVQERKRWSEKRNYVYVEELIVTESHRGRGIASSLFDCVLTWAKSRNADCVDYTPFCRAMVEEDLLGRLPDGSWYWRTDSPIVQTAVSFTVQLLPVAATPDINRYTPRRVAMKARDPEGIYASLEMEQPARIKEYRIVEDPRTKRDRT